MVVSYGNSAIVYSIFVFTSNSELQPSISVSLFVSGGIFSRHALHSLFLLFSCTSNSSHLSSVFYLVLPLMFGFRGNSSVCQNLRCIWSYAWSWIYQVVEQPLRQRVSFKALDYWRFSHSVSIVWAFGVFLLFMQLQRSFTEKTETLESIQGMRISLEQQLKELTTTKVSVWHTY